MFLNFIYNFIYTIFFLPLATLRILFKSIKNPKYLDRLSERFVLKPFIIPVKKNKKFELFNITDIWLHTVSVGEFIAAKPLILELLKNNPDYKILITCTTLTGSELINKFITEYNNNYKTPVLKHVYFPYDNKTISKRFLRLYQPKMAVFFETEIWPKMFREIKKQNIKLYIINARLSEKSYKGYLRLKNYIKKIINYVDFIAAQGDADKERFIQLGFDQSKIKTYGNIKYNIKIPEDIPQTCSKYKSLLGLKDTSLILIAASTHENEEKILLDVFLRLKKNYPDLVLVLAPRHPERFKQVEKLCLNQDSVIFEKYSDININNKKNKNNTDIFLLDTIGQLLYFYNLADVAFVGGSLVPVGGHNPLEAAVFKKPIIIGPYYSNFVQIVEDLQKHEGIYIVPPNLKDLDFLNLELKLSELLNNKSLREQMGANALEALRKHNNILENYTRLLNNYN